MKTTNKTTKKTTKKKMMEKMVLIHEMEKKHGLVFYSKELLDFEKEDDGKVTMKRSLSA